MGTRVRGRGTRGDARSETRGHDIWEVGTWFGGGGDVMSGTSGVRGSENGKADTV